MEIEDKKCSRCRKIKPITEFYKHKKIYNRSECKLCCKIMNHNNRLKNKNKEVKNQSRDKLLNEKLNSIIADCKKDKAEKAKKADIILSEIAALSQADLVSSSITDNLKNKAWRIILNED